jgi:outer membrane protein assembly factor BamB
VRRGGWALPALALALALQGCGGGDDATPDPDTLVSSEAVAFHIDAAHTGVSRVMAPAFPASAAWTKTFEGQLSYPLIAAGKVFVVESAFQSGNVVRLHALDRSTGAVAWGPVVFPGTTQSAAHAFDKGKVFVTTFDGLVLSFDAATGQPGWSTKLPGSYGFVTAPTAAAGVLYVGDGGSGSVLALDESNGTVLWTARVNGGGSSIPSITAGGVFVAYPCQYYSLAATSGAELWHYNGACSGGGGTTVPVSQGAAYVRDFDFTTTFAPFIDVRDAATGTSRTRHTSLGVFSLGPIPAVTTDAVFVLEGGTLRRFDGSLAHAGWSFAGDGTLATAPIVLDSAVVVAGTSGTIYAIDAVSGTQLWSAPLPSGVDSATDINVLMPTGLAAGEGYLVAPAGKTLTAFRVNP